MKVVIMVGPSGSGKSTYIRKNFPSAAVCSADHYFMKDGEYQFDPSKLSEAHGRCLRIFTTYVQGPYAPSHMVVDNTNTTIAELAPYAALELAYGHELEIVKIAVSEEEMSKVAARNEHGVPEKIVKVQADRAARMKLPPWWPVKLVRAEGLE